MSTTIETVVRARRDDEDEEDAPRPVPFATRYWNGRRLALELWPFHHESWSAAEPLVECIVRIVNGDERPFATLDDEVVTARQFAEMLARDARDEDVRPPLTPAPQGG